MNDALKRKKHFGAPLFFLSDTDSQSRCSWAGSPWRRARAIEKTYCSWMTEEQEEWDEEEQVKLCIQPQRENLQTEGSSSQSHKMPKKKRLSIGRIWWLEMLGMECINKMEISWSVYVFMHLPARVSMWLAGDLQGVFCHCPGDLWDWL